MRRKTAILLWLLGSLALAADAGSPARSPTGNFQSIAKGNAFRLKPPLQSLPENAPKRPPRISLLGLLTFGGKRAAIKVEWPENTGDPAMHAQYHLLTEGQHVGCITLLAVDEEARRVRIRLDDDIQVLEFP